MLTPFRVYTITSRIAGYCIIDARTLGRFIRINRACADFLMRYSSDGRIDLSHLSLSIANGIIRGYQTKILQSASYFFRYVSPRDMRASYLIDSVAAAFIENTKHLKHIRMIHRITEACGSLRSKVIENYIMTTNDLRMSDFYFNEVYTESSLVRDFFIALIEKDKRKVLRTDRNLIGSVFDFNWLTPLCTNLVVDRDVLHFLLTCDNPNIDERTALRKVLDNTENKLVFRMMMSYYCLKETYEWRTKYYVLNKEDNYIILKTNRCKCHGDYVRVGNVFKYHVDHEKDCEKNAVPAGDFIDMLQRGY